MSHHTKNMMTGFDMEQQHSLPDIPPLNPLPTFEPYDNNSMFNDHPQYHHHHPHPHHGPGMSTPPNLYLPYAPPFNAPPSHPLSHDPAVGVTSTVYESNPHFMGHGYKRKSAEAIPGNHQYLIEAAPACSSSQLNAPETAPFSFPHYATTYPQPVDQRSVRSRVGTDPPYSHGHDHFFQGNYAAPPFPPPGPIWYDQHCNGNTPDESSSFWLQPPSIPFMNGNIFYSEHIHLFFCKSYS